MVATMPAMAAAPTPAKVLGSRRAEECCVWVVSPTGYPHAHAFDECAAVLAEGLGSALGGAPETVEIVRDPADITGRVPVVLGANLLIGDAAEDLPAGSLIVNLEQLDAASRWFGDDYRSLLARHAVVDYSARNTAALHRGGLRHVRHLRLGAGAALRTVPTRRTDDVDVCFYGSLNARRSALLDELERRGMIVERLFGVYGAARDAAIARAKVVLNAHFYDAAVFESVRVTHLLANGVCVVTEGDPADPDIAPLALGLAVGRYDELADLCEELVGDAETRRTLAAAGSAALDRRSQADEWRRVLAPHTTEPDQVAPSIARPGTSAAVAALRRVSVLAPGDDIARCRSLARAADALAALGLDVHAAVIDQPDQVTRTGWECAVRGGHPLGDIERLDRFDHAEDHTVLTADRLGATLLRLAPLRRMLWWFSVDDIVRPGGPLADVALLAALGDDTGIEHHHHGAYVREFLRSRGIFSRRLDDHVAPAGLGTAAATGVLVGPAGPAADRLAAALSSVEPEILPPDRDDLASRFDACAVYLHAGPLPGRDAVLRLAVARGAVVFVPDAGAGRYVEDVPVPDIDRYDDQAVETGELAERVALALAVPDASRRRQEPYRWAVEDEHDAMVRQLARLAAPGR